MKAILKISPEEYIFSALSPRERLEASFKVAKEAFRHSSLTLKDVENAMKKIRKKVRESGK